MRAQRAQWGLYITLTISMLLLCLAIGYAGHKRTTPPPTYNYTAQLPAHSPTGQLFMLITEDAPPLPCHDKQVKDIHTQWQAILPLTWQKDYSPLCQPRYLYRKGHYIYAAMLAAFNASLLLLWGYLSYTFWNTPLQSYLYRISFPKPYIGESFLFRLALHFIIIYGCLYFPVYALVERFIGEQIYIGDYTPAAYQKIVEDLLAATKARQAQQGHLPPLDATATAKMINLYATLWDLHLAYYEAIATEDPTLQRESKEALQKHEQAWIAHYAPYIESELLATIAEDLEAKIKQINDRTPEER